MIKAYKGFNKDMTCRGFQFAEGETYHEDVAKLCDRGFHACEAPLDTFNHYGSASSVYHEVELDEVSDERQSDDTKVVGKTIKIGARLDIAGLCRAQFDYVKEHTTMEHTDPKLATAGNYGAATSRGEVTVGANGVATVRGNGVKARGGMGAVLVIAVENDTDYDIKEWKAVVVDGETVKADTWYTLENGELVEASQSARE